MIENDINKRVTMIQIDSAGLQQQQQQPALPEQKDEAIEEHNSEAELVEVENNNEEG